MNTIHSLDDLEKQLNPLTVKDAARIYGETPSSLYKKIRRNEIPGVFRDEGKKKARIKIYPREFAAFLKEQIAHGRLRWKGRKEGKVA